VGVNPEGDCEGGIPVEELPSTYHLVLLGPLGERAQEGEERVGPWRWRRCGRPCQVEEVATMMADDGRRRRRSPSSRCGGGGRSQRVPMNGWWCSRGPSGVGRGRWSIPGVPVASTINQTGGPAIERTRCLRAPMLKCRNGKGRRTRLMASPWGMGDGNRATRAPVGGRVWARESVRAWPVGVVAVVCHEKSAMR